MTPDLDSDEFVQFSNVAVFCANNEPEGEVTPEDIQTIARVNNEHAAAGEFPVIHIGHNAGREEKPILGYFSQFTTGMHRGVSTVFARFSVFKDRVGELKSYPKRSAEVRVDPAWGERRWRIPSCALLGSHEPRFPLGLMHCSVDGEPKTARYSEQAVMVSDELKEQILSVLAMTDVFAFVHEQMKTSETKPDGEEKPGEPKDQTDSQRASEGDEAVTDEEKEAKYSVMETQLAELQKKLRRTEREKVLRAVEADGAMFSVDDELADTDDLDDARFLKHVERIKRFAVKAPIGQFFNVASPAAGGEPNRKAIDPAKVKAYATQHNCTFEVAAAALGA